MVRNYCVYIHTFHFKVFWISGMVSMPLLRAVTAQWILYNPAGGFVLPSEFGKLEDTGDKRWGTERKPDTLHAAAFLAICTVSETLWCGPEPPQPPASAGTKANAPWGGDMSGRFVSVWNSYTVAHVWRIAYYGMISMSIFYSTRLWWPAKNKVQALGL